MVYPEPGYVEVEVPHSLRRRLKRRMTKKCPDWVKRTRINGDRGFFAGGKDRGYETWLMPVELECHIGWYVSFLRWIWRKRFCMFVS